MTERTKNGDSNESYGKVLDIYFAACILLYLIEQIKYYMGHLSIEFPNRNECLKRRLVSNDSISHHKHCFITKLFPNALFVRSMFILIAFWLDNVFANAL